MNRFKQMETAFTRAKTALGFRADTLGMTLRSLRYKHPAHKDKSPDLRVHHTGKQPATPSGWHP